MADLEELLDGIVDALGDIEGDISYEYDRETYVNIAVEMCIDGSCHEHEVEKEVNIVMSAETLFGSDTTVRDALEKIALTVEEIRYLKPQENRIVFRQPWPGSAAAKTAAPKREKFADEYDPPTGYTYAGEWREPLAGEVFLNKNGRVEHARRDHTTGSFNFRHILVALPGTSVPATGVNTPVPAAEDISGSPFSESQLASAKPL